MTETSTTPCWLVGGQVLTPSGAWEARDLAVAGDRIVALGEAPAAGAVAQVDVAGARVVPGLIETHVHGMLAHDVADATPEALAAIGAALARHGVTAWLPTTVACAPEALEATLQAVAAAQAEASPRGAHVLGAHLESNFLAPRYKGAQPEAWLRPPDDAGLRDVLARWRGAISLLTLAPELPGALDLVRTLVSWGVVVSVGHSDATHDEVLAAVEAGATRVTHLCNAQRPFHHREPGVVGAGLVCDDLFTEVIADLVHVHPAGLEEARRCKGPGRLVLVSDALRGTGLPPGRYELGGQETTLDGQVARLADGTIAGSTLTLDRAVAHMAHHTGASLADAFWMAAAAPAESLQLPDRGALAPGMRADLALFDEQLRCTGTMVGGAWVHGPASGSAGRREP
ncbi:MAG: N-acetylglucosamine-6-phosphate deacetylase [Candidatus Sericytochromatia bacterium]|nr:N-acetylglucosamine-6-phosphate deacetylase [Candidatus Sericytochromatia bacterium]